MSRAIVVLNPTSELFISGPFDTDNQKISTFTITNPNRSNKIVAFKIKSTQANLMTVSPKCGYLASGATVPVTITWSKFKLDPEFQKLRIRSEMMLVQSVFVVNPDDIASGTSFGEIWSAADACDIVDKRLKIRFLSPEEYEEKLNENVKNVNLVPWNKPQNNQEKTKLNDIQENPDVRRQKDSFNLDDGKRRFFSMTDDNNRKRKEEQKSQQRTLSIGNDDHQRDVEKEEFGKKNEKPKSLGPIVIDDEEGMYIHDEEGNRKKLPEFKKNSQHQSGNYGRYRYGNESSSLDDPWTSAGNQVRKIIGEGNDKNHQGDNFNSRNSYRPQEMRGDNYWSRDLNRYSSSARNNYPGNYGNGNGWTSPETRRPRNNYPGNGNNWTSPETQNPRNNYPGNGNNWTSPETQNPRNNYPGNGNNWTSPETRRPTIKPDRIESSSMSSSSEDNSDNFGKKATQNIAKNKDNSYAKRDIKANDYCGTLKNKDMDNDSFVRRDIQVKNNCESLRMPREKNRLFQSIEEEERNKSYHNRPISDNNNYSKNANFSSTKPTNDNTYLESERSWKKSKSKKIQTEKPIFHFPILERNLKKKSLEEETEDEQLKTVDEQLKTVTCPERSVVVGDTHTSAVVALGLGMFAMGVLLGKVFRNV